MALTPSEIDLLRDTLRVFQTRKRQFADFFYENLFRLAPHTRALFGPDIDEQTEKTMLALAAIVGQIHRIEAFTPMVAELGHRHAAYGVAVEDYAFVGEALIETITQIFGDELRPEVYAVWRAAYVEISRPMIAAAYPPAADVAA